MSNPKTTLIPSELPTSLEGKVKFSKTRSSEYGKQFYCNIGTSRDPIIIQLPSLTYFPHINVSKVDGKKSFSLSTTFRVVNTKAEALAHWAIEESDTPGERALKQFVNFMLNLDEETVKHLAAISETDGLSDEPMTVTLVRASGKYHTNLQIYKSKSGKNKDKWVVGFSVDVGFYPQCSALVRDHTKTPMELTTSNWTEVFPLTKDGNAKPVTLTLVVRKKPINIGATGWSNKWTADVITLGKPTSGVTRGVARDDVPDDEVPNTTGEEASASAPAPTVDESEFAEEDDDEDEAPPAPAPAPPPAPAPKTGVKGKKTKA